VKKLITAIVRFINPNHGRMYIHRAPCRTTLTDKYTRQFNYIRRLERQG
jgi:hypothetical protein